MTLFVKDANTTVQSLSTAIDGNGNLVPLHAPAATNAQGVSTPVGLLNPLPVMNTAGAVASDGTNFGISKDRGVESGCLLGLGVEPKEWADL